MSGVGRVEQRMVHRTGLDANAYQRLIAIDLRHRFYSRGGPAGPPGDCPDVVIEATPQTAQRLKLLGLIAWPRPSGIEILNSSGQAAALADVLADVAAMLGGPPPPEVAHRLFGPPLLFTLRLADPTFLNVTALPPALGNGQASLCFSNRGNRPDPSANRGEGVAELAEGHAEGAPNSDQAPGDAAERKAALDAAAHDARLPQSLLYIPSANIMDAEAERGDLLAAPRGAPFGLVEILIVRPPDEQSATAIFPVSLTLDGSGDKGPGRGCLTGVRYTITFESRSTLWRYVVVDSRGTLDMASLSIADAVNPPICFTREAAPEMPGGRAAAAFISASPVLLLQKPAGRFALEGAARAGRSTKRTLLKPLPAPSRGMPAARDAQGAAGVSDIYVFV